MSTKITLPVKLDDTTYPMLKQAIEKMARETQVTTSPEHINNILRDRLYFVHVNFTMSRFFVIFYIDNLLPGPKD